jgi:hypothetical protein
VSAAGPGARARLGLGLGAVLTAWALPGTFVGSVLYVRDINLVWHPQVEGFVRAVQEGAWPLWDPGPGFGQPLLADPGAMIAYPPTWLNLLLPAWLYYSVFAVAHLAFSVLGAFLLARRWRYSRAAAATSAALWGLSGPLLSLVSLWHHYASAAWLPWVFLTAERALLRRRARDRVLWALAVAAQIVAGSADMCALTLLALAAYAATRWIRWRRPWSTRNRRLVASAALALGLALALSAVLWMPALEVARHSARFGLAEETRTFWSVHPLGLLQAWCPNLWYGVTLKDALWAALWESREPFLTTLYVGAASVTLVAAAATGRLPRRRYLIGLALTAILIALGRHAPFYGAAVALFPPVRILRYPMKCCLPAAFAWSLLAGMGVDALRRARGGRPARAALVAGALLAAGAGAAALLLLARPQLAAELIDLQPDAARAVRPLVGSLAAAGAAALAATALAAAALRQPARAARWAAAAGVLAVADVGWFNRATNETGDRRIYARPPVVDVLRREKAQRVYVYDYAFGKDGRSKMPRLAAIPPGWSAGGALALAQQMSLMPPSAGRWAIDTAYEHDLRGLYRYEATQLVLLVDRMEQTPFVPLALRMGATTHVVALHTRDMEAYRLIESLPGLYQQPVHVFEVPQPLPRAYAVAGVRPASGVEAFGVLLRGDFDPTREVLLPAGTPAGAAPGPAGTVRVAARTADRLLLEAVMERAGWVVAVEGYGPGWRAWVDGHPQPVLPANLAFRAVAVEAGAHTVEMRYRPRGAMAGAALTLAAAALAAAVAAWRRRPAPPAMVGAP